MMTGPTRTPAKTAKPADKVAPAAEKVTPAKATPAAVETAADSMKAEKPKRPKAKAAEINFDALAIVEDDAPTYSGGAPTRQNPFVPALTSSWEAFQTGGKHGRSVVFGTEAEAKTATGLIRRAATAVGCGVAVQIEQVDGKYKVRFGAKKKRADAGSRRTES